MAPTSQKKLKGKEVSKMRGKFEQLLSRKPQGKLQRKMGAPQVKMSLSDDAVMHYLAASVAPFSEEAAGARVPGPYAVRTRTTRVVVPFQFTPAAGLVDADAVFTANPLYCLWGANANTRWVGGEASGSTPNIAFKTAVTGATLSGLYYKYRTVAWGIRVKVDSSYTTTSGRMFVAVVPAGSQLPTTTPTGSTGATLEGALQVLGAPVDSSGRVSASIVSFPVSQEYAMSEVLANGGVEICAPKTGAAHTTFLHIGDALDQPALATFNTATGVANSYHSLDNGCVAGQSNILLRFDGLTIGSTITVEVVYHIEGSPVPAASAFISDASGMDALCPTAVLEHANMAAMAVPSIGFDKRNISDASGLRKLISSAGAEGLKAAGRGLAKGVLGLLA